MDRKELTADTKLREILQYGQGQDDAIAEIFEAFKKFRDGYYELVNYGDDWWKVLNQDTMFDEMMEEQWSKFEEIDFMSITGKMEKALAGTYVSFSAFADVVAKAAEEGYGFQPSRERKEEC